jgi:2-polyprenyl-3-methyl-5-hydroxy-6-metoxy-1,4-benzoquinol methylase
MENWFKDWFSSDLYLSVYSHRNEEEAQQVCNLILESVKLDRGSYILDAACGAGRHSNYFSSLGYNVTGFDLSKTLLNVAKLQALQNNLATDFICVDIRNVFFKQKFNLIVNLFTSFGYFFNDEENFSFIKNSFDFLKPGGYYVLDYFNPKFVMNNLVAESRREISGVFLLEKRCIINNRVEKEIHITRDGIEQNFTESVALYSPEILIETISSFGFNLCNTFGDYEGNEFEENVSKRLILVFQK